MFLGTPEFAVPALRAVAARCEVVAVVTRPDRARGRGRHTGASAVAEAARGLSLPVLQPEDVNAAGARAELARTGCDLFAVVAFGTILSPELLRVPRLGSLNLHGSLLPEYRGASPVQRALWDGRAWTGVTTLWMDEGIDTGDCVLQRWVAVEPEDDAARLAARLAEAGAPLLAESLCLAHQGKAPRRPQEIGAGSYAGRLEKRDGEVDWTLDAVAVWNRQRAVTPWPGASCELEGRRIQITRARPVDLLPHDQPPGTVIEVGRSQVTVCCGRGSLALERVRPEARAEMEAAEWARGARLAPGARFAAAGREAHA